MGHVGGNYTAVSTMGPAATGDQFGMTIEEINGDPITFDNISAVFTYSATHEECPFCDENLPCSFAQLNVTDLSFDCDWQIISGDWEPGGVAISIVTEDSNASAYALSENPAQSNRMSAAGYFTCGASGDQAKVLAGGEIEATYTVSDTGCGEIEISGPDGTETLKVAKLLPGEEYYFCVSYDGTRAYAGVMIPRPQLEGGTLLQDHDLVMRRVGVTTTAANVANVNWTAGIGTGTVTDYVQFRDVGFLMLTSGTGVTCLECFGCASGYYQSGDPFGDQCEFEVAYTPLSGTGDIVLDDAEYALMDAGDNGLGFVEALFSTEAAGVKSRVYIGDDGTLAGPWAEIEWGTDDSTLRLSSGEELTVATTDGDVAHLWVCLNGTALTATLNPQVGISPPADGSLVGVVAGGAIGPYAGFESHDGESTFTDFLCGPLVRQDGDTCNACIIVCDVCENDLFASQWMVELEGITGDEMMFPCCSNYGGVFIALPDAPCQAIWENPGDACDAPGYVLVVLSDNGATTRITVEVYIQPSFPAAGITVTYQLDVPKPFDCRNVAQLEIPYLSHDGGGGDCNPTSSSVFLTSA